MLRGKTRNIGSYVGVSERGNVLSKVTTISLRTIPWTTRKKTMMTKTTIQNTMMRLKA